MINKHTFHDFDRLYLSYDIFMAKNKIVFENFVFFSIQTKQCNIDMSTLRCICLICSSNTELLNY